jgi:hypothetical protein
MTTPDDGDASLDETRRAVRLAAFCVLGLVTSGFLCIRIIHKQGLWANSLFYSQFASIEPPALIVLALFAIAVLLLLRRPPEDGATDAPWWLRIGLRGAITIALAVFVVTVAGTYLVFHHYPFVDDEYSGWFQSVIYSRGDRTATLPAHWCQWIASMTPTSIAIVTPCTWRLGYLPIHAWIRAGFMAAGIDAFAEPTMAALSTVLVFLVVRQAWPDRPQRAALATIFFAASTQFLMMSMTAFSMTAHLFFSMVWLWLFVRPERWALILLPWWGFLAIGVHSPHPHVLFVAPLLLKFVVERRVAATLYCGAVYFLALAYWIGRIGGTPTDIVSVTAGSSSAVVSQAVSVGRGLKFDGITTSMSLSLFATWSVPVVLLCTLVALILWKRLDGLSRYLALSMLATLLARALFFPYQGAGWGYRYGFAVLGNLAILAAIGCEHLMEATGRRRTSVLIGAALATAVALALPLRGVQANRIVRPFYQASDWMEHLSADVVVLPANASPYASQLIRNDPFLRDSPKIMEQSVLGDAGLEAVMRQHHGRVKVVTAQDLSRFHFIP